MPTLLQSYTKRILLLLGSIGFSLIVLESLTRILWKETGYDYPTGLHIPDDHRGYKYRPHFTGTFPPGPYSDIEIQINSDGLRDYDRTIAKTGFRIMGLGDSVTFGAGVAFEATYLSQLENTLTEKGFEIEIVKAGVNGYEFEQQFSYYMEEGFKYKPDVLLIGVVLNDARDIDPQKVKHRMFESVFHRSAKLLGKHCKCCKMIHQQIKGIGNHNERYFKSVYELWTGEPWENYQSRLLEMKDHVKGDIILVLFPYTQQFKASSNYGREPQEKLIDFSHANQIKLIDLTPFLDQPNFEAYYLYNDNVHLSEQGHKLVSEVLYKKLFEENMIGPDRIKSAEKVWH